jgi:hypothetical protein
MNRRFNTLFSSSGYLEFEFAPAVISADVTAGLHSNFVLSGCFIFNMALLGRLGPDSLKMNRAFFFRNDGPLLQQARSRRHCLTCSNDEKLDQKDNFEKRKRLPLSFNAKREP